MGMLVFFRTEILSVDGRTTPAGTTETGLTELDGRNLGRSGQSFRAGDFERQPRFDALAIVERKSEHAIHAALVLGAVGDRLRSGDCQDLCAERVKVELNASQFLLELVVAYPATASVVVRVDALLTLAI